MHNYDDGEEVDLQPGGEESAPRTGHAVSTVAMCATVVAAAAAVVLVALAVGCLVTVLGDSPEHSPYGHGFVLDLGSSGSRVYVYEWEHGDEGVEEASLDRIAGLMTEDNEQVGLKVTPGVSFFAGAPQAAVDSIIPLLEFAKDVAHELGQEPSECPLLCYATGGMRALDSKDREAIEDAIRDYITDHYDFLIEDSNESIRTITGHEEAFFDYVTVQQILQVYDPEERREQKLGALDMGGESLEVAFRFEPDSREAEEEVTHAETSKFFSEVRFDDDDALIFGESYVNMGHESALQMGMLIVSQSQDWITPLPSGSFSSSGEGDALVYVSPCFHVGYVYVTDDSDRYFDVGTQFYGSGNWSECAQVVALLIGTDADCNFSNCAFNGQYEPPAHDFFVAMDDFATTASFFLLSYQPRLNEFVPPTREFCGMTWDELHDDDWYSNFKESTLRRFCFQGIYVHQLLTAGMGLDGTKARVVFADSLYDTPLNWGLGAMRQHLAGRADVYFSSDSSMAIESVTNQSPAEVVSPSS